MAMQGVDVTVSVNCIGSLQARVQQSGNSPTIYLVDSAAGHCDVTNFYSLSYRVAACYASTRSATQHMHLCFIADADCTPTAQAQAGCARHAKVA